MNQIIWGFCLVFTGVGLIGNFTGYFNILFNGWWTLFIILPATVDLFIKKQKLGSLCLITVGVTLLLQQLDIISGSLIWKILLSSFIIVIGINMIFLKHNNFNSTDSHIPIEVKNHKTESYTAIFSGQEMDCINEEFTDSRLTAIFGGFKLDLSKAIIRKDVFIEIEAIFGGCTIIVPSNVNIKTNGTNIFGGVSNKINYENPNASTIYIRSNAIFGGVEIR